MKVNERFYTTTLRTAADYTVGSLVRLWHEYDGWLALQQEHCDDYYSPHRIARMYFVHSKNDVGVTLRRPDGYHVSYNPIPAGEWLRAEQITEDGNPGLEARRAQRAARRWR